MESWPGPCVMAWRGAPPQFQQGRVGSCGRQVQGPQGEIPAGLELPEGRGSDVVCTRLGCASPAPPPPACGRRASAAGARGVPTPLPGSIHSLPPFARVHAAWPDGSASQLFPWQHRGAGQITPNSFPPVSNHRWTSKVASARLKGQTVVFVSASRSGIRRGGECGSMQT